jgi:hypothetical protein
MELRREVDEANRMLGRYRRDPLGEIERINSDDRRRKRNWRLRQLTDRYQDPKLPKPEGPE